MDYTQLLQPLFNALWYLIPLAILAAVIILPWFKGKAGEAVVNLYAKLFLDKTRYHFTRSIGEPTEDGTNRINNIIVFRYGVFVVETKNMIGRIFGSEKQCYWYPKIYKHSQSFQAPLHQNYKHMRALQSLLELSGKKVHCPTVWKRLLVLGGLVRFLNSCYFQRVSFMSFEKSG